MDFLITLLDAIAEPLAVVGGSALLATVTKNTARDTRWQPLLSFINALGANFGRARNDYTRD